MGQNPESGNREPSRGGRTGMQVFVRLSPALNAALRRALLERRLAGEKPYTLQSVIAEAVADWLVKHGPMPEPPEGPADVG